MTKTVNEAERIAGEDCPATFGRESVSHCFVTVTRSSYRPTPYRMCSKCARILSETPHAIGNDAAAAVTLSEIAGRPQHAE